MNKMMRKKSDRALLAIVRVSVDSDLDTVQNLNRRTICRGVSSQRDSTYSRAICMGFSSERKCAILEQPNICRVESGKRIESAGFMVLCAHEKRSI